MHLKQTNFIFFFQQLFNCHLLHRLSMPDNDLTVLPAAIANLINLRELDVSKNSKRALSVSMCQFGVWFFQVIGMNRVCLYSCVCVCV